MAIKVILFLVLLGLIYGVSGSKEWKIVSHDYTCYTQGLSFINKTHLLESCGLYGESYFQILSYDSDYGLTTTYKSPIFPREYFLEGSIHFPLNNIIYILTWRENTVFRYKLDDKTGDLTKLDNLGWGSQGWGMTHNNSHIFISDGSSTIYIVDENLTILDKFNVSGLSARGTVHLQHLNELEWVQDDSGRQYIYANIYTTNIIVKIDIELKKAVKGFDLSIQAKVAGKQRKLKKDEVLNGIAVLPEEDLLLATGKRWANAFTNALCNF